MRIRYQRALVTPLLQQSKGYASAVVQLLQCCGWSQSCLLKLQRSRAAIHRMSESCVQGLGRFAVVGTFPFSYFHETTEQTKMASLIQHHGGRRLRQNDLESRLVSRKEWHIRLSLRREPSLVHLPCVCLWMSVSESPRIHPRRFKALTCSVIKPQFAVLNKTRESGIQKVA